MIALLRVALWCFLAAAILLGGELVADSTAVPRAARAEAMASPRVTISEGQLSSDSLTKVLMSLAPFRASRRAALVPYDPRRGVSPAGPTLTRPALVLHGIVWGGQPGAVLEGIPGVIGDYLLAPGDTLAGLRIRRIERTRVTIDGLDTTWVLRLPSPR